MQRRQPGDRRSGRRRPQRKGGHHHDHRWAGTRPAHRPPPVGP